MLPQWRNSKFIEGAPHFRSVSYEPEQEGRLSLPLHACAFQGKAIYFNENYVMQNFPYGGAAAEFTIFCQVPNNLQIIAIGGPSSF